VAVNSSQTISWKSKARVSSFTLIDVGGGGGRGDGSQVDRS